MSLRRSEFPENQHCPDHSGMMTWLKGLVGISTLCAGLLSYSVFWQAPTLRLEIAKEIARIEQRTVKLEEKMDAIVCRIETLEGKRE